jgi:hypothetical protein
MPLPHTFPDLETARKIRPSVMPAANIHTSIAALTQRSEAVENGSFAMIQVRQPEHSATVVWLDFVFTHDDGLPVQQPRELPQIV